MSRDRIEFPCNDPNDPKSGYTAMEFGVDIGAGARYGRFALSARYEPGLMNVSRNDSTYISGDVRHTANTARNKTLLIIRGVYLGH